MEEKKIEIGGISVNYKTFGAGAPVLVLHGWGGSSDSWVKVSELLEKHGYMAVCPDLPGFGKSQEPREPWSVDKYLEFVELFAGQLNLNSFFLIGHSFGGGLALAFSALNSQSVKMLVLCDAAAIRTERLDWRQSCAKRMAYAKKLVINMPFFKNIRPLAQKIIYKIAGVHDYHKATPLMKETFNNIIEEDLQKYAGSIRIPVLIAWGERDKSTPVEDAYTLQHLIPGSRIEAIKGVGHNPHREAPEVLAEKIINFFKTK